MRRRARPGTSEYAEDIPTAGGNGKTPAEGGGNKTAAQIDHLGAGRQGVRKLAKLGRTGAAAAQFAQQTAPVTTTAATTPTSTTPAPGTGTKTHPNPSARVSQQHRLTASGGSALGALGRIVGGSDVGGIGIFLPLMLVVGAVVAVGVAAVRTRHPRSGPTQP